MMPAELDIPAQEAVTGVLAFLLLAVAVLVVAVVVFMVVATVKRYRAARTAGLDPFAGDVQVAGAVARSAALAPDRPVADRLAEVERLHQQRQITDAERDAARARILGTL